MRELLSECEHVRDKLRCEALRSILDKVLFAAEFAYYNLGDKAKAPLIHALLSLVSQQAQISPKFTYSEHRPYVVSFAHWLTQQNSPQIDSDFMIVAFMGLFLSDKDAIDSAGPLTPELAADLIVGLLRTALRERRSEECVRACLDAVQNAMYFATPGVKSLLSSNSFVSYLSDCAKLFSLTHAKRILDTLTNSIGEDITLNSQILQNVKLMRMFDDAMVSNKPEVVRAHFHLLSMMLLCQEDTQIMCYLLQNTRIFDHILLTAASPPWVAYTACACKIIGQSFRLAENALNKGLVSRDPYLDNIIKDKRLLRAFMCIMHSKVNAIHAAFNDFVLAELSPEVIENLESLDN